MIRLMNSAMMPQDGIYGRFSQNLEWWTNSLRSKIQNGSEWKSYIGYPQLAEILSDLLGVTIPVSRDQADLEDGDLIYVAKLKYRVNPSEKSERQHGSYIEDYEFILVEYSR